MIPLNPLLASSGQDALDTLSTLCQGSLICAQRLISLNLRVAQTLMAGNVAGTDALLRAPDMTTIYDTQSRLSHQLMQQAVGYAVDFNEVVAENQQELADLLKARTDSLTRALSGQGVEQSAASATLMAGVVRSMLDSATQARDSMLEVARQAERNLTKP
ncbi:phasin family protein [Zoogloea sp.]|uniref:phasin family protein n=1 Tax=Zoogloea sp. TaxID=49181 RepID=UPI00262986BC|nr:phasin family protein [Zoogloea sp.]MDD3352190.1 phasin family protein [Zoogloea sp.]